MQRYKPTWIISICLFLSVIQLPAQGVVFTDTIRVHYNIPYIPIDPGFCKNGNEILREMAKDVLREPRLVRLNIQFDLGISVRQVFPNTLLQIYFRKPAIYGDFRYRRFSVADVLLPSRMNFNLRWALKADTTSFSVASFMNREVGPGDTLVLSAPVAPYDINADTLMIRDLVLYYDENALNAFKDRIHLINDYYASAAILDTMELMANDIDINDVADLPFLYMKVTEFNKVVNRIALRMFPEKLLKDGFDPKGLTEKFLLFYKFSRSITFTLQDQLNKTGAIPWSGNIDSLADYFTGRMLSYILQSQIMDDIQGDIYRDYVDTYFDQYAFSNEAEVLNQMLRKMFPDARPDTLVSFVSGKIYVSYCRRARQLVDREQYANAFILMENGGKFLSKNPAMASSSGGDSVMSDAAHGIYNAFIGIASSCIRSGKYIMADDYLAKAENYRRLNASLVQSDSIYKTVFSELFFLRNTVCDQLLTEQKFLEALTCYESFERTYDNRHLTNIQTTLEDKKDQARRGLFYLLVKQTRDALMHSETDSAVGYYDQAALLQKGLRGNPDIFISLDSLTIPVEKIRYNMFIKEGINALDRRFFSFALTQLNHAKRISEKYGFVPEPAYDSLYRKAVKQVLMIQLSSSQKQIWSNQFDTVQENLGRIREIGAQVGLMQDPDFLVALDRFKGKIQEQHCRNLFDSIELRLIRADRNIALKNFQNGCQYLKQALELSASKKDCMFPEGQVRDTLEKYRRPAEYQQKLMETNRVISIGSYLNAVQMMAECEAFYQSWHLEHFDLPLIPMYDFIKDRSNPYLTEKAIGYFYGKAEFREAFRYLKLMHLQGFSERNISSTMEQLAKRIAMEDFRTRWQENPEQIIAGYSGNDSWFSLFRSAYLGEWARLLKSAAPVLKQ